MLPPLTYLLIYVCAFRTLRNRLVRWDYTKWLFSVVNETRRRLLAVTYYKDFIVTENYLRFVIGRHITSKCLVNVYKLHVHVYQTKQNAHL